MRITCLSFLACCMFLTASAQVEKETKEKVKTETGKEKTKIEKEEGEVKEKTKIKEEGQPTIKEKTKTDAAGQPRDKTKTDPAGHHHDMNHRTDVTADTMKSTYVAYVWSTDKDVWWNPAEYSYHFVTTTPATDPNQPVKRDLGTGMTDRAPVFTEACYREADPLKCTKFEINEGLMMTTYPDSNLAKNHGGVEYVILTIDETGKMVGDYEVVSQQNRCPGCAQAAVNAVANLMTNEKWYPATRNGKPIRARVAIPVRFSMTTDTNK